jgi:hypothetical protein
MVFTDWRNPTLGTAVTPAITVQTFGAHRAIFRGLINVYIAACRLAWTNIDYLVVSGRRL